VKELLERMNVASHLHHDTKSWAKRAISLHNIWNNHKWKYSKCSWASTNYLVGTQSCYAYNEQHMVYIYIVLLVRFMYLVYKWTHSGIYISRGSSQILHFYQQKSLYILMCIRNVKAERRITYRTRLYINMEPIPSIVTASEKWDRRCTENWTSTGKWNG
jgi:hypothetical protein